MNAARDVLNATAVYGGLDYLGEVVERRCGTWTAYSASGADLGTYADARAATMAVIASQGRRA